jgi:hypothetical protein
MNSFKKRLLLLRWLPVLWHLLLLLRLVVSITQTVLIIAATIVVIMVIMATTAAETAIMSLGSLRGLLLGTFWEAPPMHLATVLDKSKIIYTIVIPDKGSKADRRSGIQRKSEAKPHKTLDPVCASVLRMRGRDDE